MPFLSGHGLLKKIVVTLLLLPALVYLTRVGVADFLRLAPCAYIEAVQKGGARLDPAELVKSRERLLLARSWDSGNPIIPEFLGQIAFMRAQLISLSPSAQAVFLREAIVAFQEAIELRPNSAFLWADRMTAGSWLLEINSRLGRNDGNVKSELSVIRMALCRASVLDPWNPQVLTQLVKVGTLRYMEFSPEERMIIDGAVARAKQLNLKIRPIK